MEEAPGHPELLLVEQMRPLVLLLRPPGLLPRVRLRQLVLIPLPEGSLRHLLPLVLPRALISLRPVVRHLQVLLCHLHMKSLHSLFH